MSFYKMSRGVSLTRPSRRRSRLVFRLGAWVCLVSASVVLQSAFAGIDAVAYDSTREVAVVTLSEVTAASQIYACRAEADCGSNPSDWPEVRCVAEVAVGATSVDVRLPVAWRTKTGSVRFLLVDRLAYLPLAYIHSAGGAWIDTGVVPDTTTKITLKHRTTVRRPIFGIGEYFSCFQWIQQKVIFDCFSGDVQVDHEETADVQTMSFGYDGYGVDGKHYKDVPSFVKSLPSAKSFPLGGRYDFTRASVICENTDFDIYSATIEKGGSTVRTFLPCLKDGEAGLYDSARGAFYLSLGSAKFVAGPVDFTKLVVRSVSESVSVMPEIRRLTAATYDHVTGCVDVLVSPGAQTKALYMAYDTTDRGEDILAWPIVRQVATIPGGTTQVAVPVPEAWRSVFGRLRFFLGPRDLPSGRRVHALYSTGTQYIDSGIVPDTKTMTRVRYQLCKSGASKYYMPPFGISDHYYCFDNSQSTYWGFFGKESSFAKHATDFAVHTLEFGSGGAFVDQVWQADITAGPSSVTLTQTLPFFGRRDYNAQTIKLNAAMRIFSARVERDGAVLGDFVPVLGADGKGAFYNQVDGVFHPNSGTGDFEYDEDLVAGEDFAPELIEDVSPFVALGGAALSAAFEGRMLKVSVGAFDEAGYLFVGRSSGNVIGSPSDCAAVVYLGEVPATGGTFLYPLPSGRDWRTAGTVLRVFHSSATRPYVRIHEYLHGNGGPWLDTGVVPDRTTRISAKYRTSHKMPFFGLAGYFSCFQCTTKIVYFDYFSGDVTVNVNENTGIHTMSLGPEGYTLDGFLLAAVPSIRHVLPSERSFPLFGRYDFDVASVNKLNNDCDIYWCEIEKGGEKVRAFVPCELPDGTFGLYDRVNGVVHANESTTGAFTVGGASSSDPLLDDFETLAASSPLVVSRQGLVVLFR